MPALVAAVRDARLGSGWLDGEIVVADAQGAPDFQALQNAFDAARSDAHRVLRLRPALFAGHDLRSVPLVERRAHAAALLERAPPQERVRFSEDFDADARRSCCRPPAGWGSRAHRQAHGRALRVAPQPDWIKLKCRQRQEFVVGGYTEPQGLAHRLRLAAARRPRRGRAAALRRQRRHRLRPEAARRAEAARSTRSPTDADAVRETAARRARPLGQAEAGGRGRFGEWTRDGRIRHPVFHGLRDDKHARDDHARGGGAPARSRRRERSAGARRPRGRKTPRTSRRATARRPRRTRERRAATTVDGVRITHPERVIDTSSGITKLDLVDYYVDVAELMLPHLRAARSSLVRAPDGIAASCSSRSMPTALRSPAPRSSTRRSRPATRRCWRSTRAGAVGAAQMNVIEFHTWNATSQRLEQARPHGLRPRPRRRRRLARRSRKARTLMQALLDELGLPSFLKTSGGKGLHVVVPLTPQHDWDTVKDFSQAIVAAPGRRRCPSASSPRAGRRTASARSSSTTCATASARPPPAPGRRARGPGWASRCRRVGRTAALSGGAHWTIRNARERFEGTATPGATTRRARQTADEGAEGARLRAASPPEAARVPQIAPTLPGHRQHDPGDVAGARGAARNT